MDASERYMRAALRIKTGRPCRDWTLDEVVDSFAIVGRQGASLDEWAQSLGLNADSPAERTETPAQPTPEEQAAHNAAVLPDLLAIPGVSLKP